MANSPISPRLIRWAFLIEASQSSRIRRASIRNDLPAGVSVTPLRWRSKNSNWRNFMGGFACNLTHLCSSFGGLTDIKDDYQHHYPPTVECKREFFETDIRR
jgi:hypothetical protein